MMLAMYVSSYMMYLNVTVADLDISHITLLSKWLLAAV